MNRQMKRMHLISKLQRLHLSLKIGQAILLFAVLSLTAACGLELAATPPTITTPTIAPTPTSLSQFTIIPTSAQSGLAELDSYRANLVIDFKGTRRDEPTGGQVEHLFEIQQPATQHYYLYVGGTLPANSLATGVTEFFQRDQTIWLRKPGETTWSQFDQTHVTATSLKLPEPLGLILLPRTVVMPPQQENLNDLSVQRYRFTEQDLTTPGYSFERASGTIWVAARDDYVVQYVLSATLRLTQANPPLPLFDEGQLNVRYFLTDINAAFPITLPLNIAAGNAALDTLPRLPDAEVITVLPTLIEYTSAISSISATLFYRRELVPLAWEERDATIFNDKARLTFAQEDQTLDVIIAANGETRKIRISLALH